jgi:hypothetical protein
MSGQEYTIAYIILLITLFCDTAVTKWQGSKAGTTDQIDMQCIFYICSIYRIEGIFMGARIY